MADQMWHYTLDYDQQSPVTFEELQELADKGTLRPEDHVWTKGMADWQEARTIPDLFADGAGAPPPRQPAREPEREPIADRSQPARDDVDDRERSRPARREDRGERDDRDEIPSDGRKPDAGTKGVVLSIGTGFGLFVLLLALGFAVVRIFFGSIDA